MQRLEPSIVLQQIENLKLLFPDIWDDGEEKLLTDCLEAETDIYEFLTVLVDQMQDAASMAGGIAGRIAELSIRQERFVRREKAMRVLAFRLMQAAELKKAELHEATLSIRNGSERVEILNEESVPDILCEFKRVPNKTRIKELLKENGKDINWAALVQGEPSLSVRTK